jgi:hypothetical protein
VVYCCSIGDWRIGRALVQLVCASVLLIQIAVIDCVRMKSLFMTLLCVRVASGSKESRRSYYWKKDRIQVIVEAGIKSRIELFAR